MDWALLESRILWLIVGCLIGFVAGYMTRLRQEMSKMNDRLTTLEHPEGDSSD